MHSCAELALRAALRKHIMTTLTPEVLSSAAVGLGVCDARFQSRDAAPVKVYIASGEQIGLAGVRGGSEPLTPLAHMVLGGPGNDKTSGFINGRAQLTVEQPTRRTDIQTYTQTHRHTDIQTDRHTYRHTGRQTARQPGSHTARQTDIQP